MKTSRRWKSALGAGVLLALVGHTRSHAMTTAELIGALEKAGAGEAKVLKSFPSEIEETRHDFLGDGVHLRVTVLNPHHPHRLDYVARPDGTIYRLKLGAAELERMQAGLGIRIQNPDIALRYAQWVLEMTEGPALWLLSSVDDVPFQPVGKGEDALAKRIAKAKQDIARRISKPSARPKDDGFVVTQEAVRDRDLVRYEVSVSERGRTAIEKEKLVAEIPVVYVLAH